MDQAMNHREVSVEFAGMGEPLLNPEIYRFVECVSKQAETSLTTNISALTSQNVQRLVKAGLHYLTVSFNGADPSTYETMMGGLSFERAQRYLRSAVEVTRGTGTRVRANVTVAQPTQAQLPAIRRYLIDSGIETIIFSKCHNRGGHLKNAGLCTTSMPPASVGLGRCDIFSTTLFTAWNGDVLSCCHDLAGANRLGNLLSDTMDVIRARKQDILEKGVDFDMCVKCNDMYRYMNAPTPDGSPLSDWIYNLYAQEDDRTRVLMDRIQFLSSRVSELSEQLEQVHSNRSWKLAKKLEQIRLRLIPRGGLRERMLRRVMRGLGV